MNVNEIDVLKSKLQLISSDNLELKRIIEDYKKENRYLRKLIKEKNLEIECLKNKNSHQLTINSY